MEFQENEDFIPWGNNDVCLESLMPVLSSGSFSSANKMQKSAQRVDPFYLDVSAT